MDHEGGPSEEDAQCHPSRGGVRIGVFHELFVAPGRHALRVTFTPLGTGGPPPLTLDTVVTLGVRDVGLVTLDETGQLLLKRR